jgi:hypothetical protein
MAASSVVGSHSIKADRSLGEGEKSKARGKRRNQPLLRELAGYLVFQAFNQTKPRYCYGSPERLVCRIQGFSIFS